MNRGTLFFAVCGALGLSVSVVVGQLKVSQTCVKNVTNCTDPQLTPSGISSCRGLHQGDCDSACTYCTGGTITSANLCVQDHIYTGSPHTCTTSNTQPCGKQNTNTCGWTESGGYCGCPTTSGNHGDDCTFNTCTS